jgi:ribose transport system permease protein
MNAGTAIEPGPPVDTAQPVPRSIPRWADQRLGLVIVVGLLVALFGSLRPMFFNQQLVLFGLLRDIGILTVVGLAQMAVLSIGHMNLAVGRMAAFSAMFAGIAYDKLHMPLVGGLLVCLLAGVCIGGLTGAIIARSGVHSFVVTLAMDFLLLGLVALVYSGLTDAAAFTSRPAGITGLRNDSLGDLCFGGVCGPAAVPQLLIFPAIAMLAVGYLYSRTRLGRELLVTGSNERAARMSGVPTRRRVITAHALSGLLAALAGFLLGVTNGSFTASIGGSFLLPSFLGPVLGGTLLGGGFVSVLGTLLGTALVSVVQTGLNLLQVSLQSLNIYLGLILVVAIAAERLRTAASGSSTSDAATGAVGSAIAARARGARAFFASNVATLLILSVTGFAILTVAGGGDLLLSSNARENFLSFLAVPILIGLAQLVVLAVGQMNLSVGALGGFIAVTMGVLMTKHGVPLAPTIVVALLLGVVAGLLNGILIVVTRVNGFVATLATMTILLGLQYGVIGTSTVGGYSAALKSFGNASLVSVPAIFLTALAVAGATGFFLARTVPGRRMLASGGNPLAARLSGISNDRSVILAHTLSGLIIAVAAVLTVASLDNVNTSIGGDWLLASFAAPIIGGVALTGGSVSVTGMVLAAVIVRLVDTGRAEFSLDPSWVNFVVGTVVLGTVLLGRIRESRGARATGAPA